MSNLISAEVITGNSVYGVRQAQYTVGKESGKNFIDAMSLAAFKQAVAIESATTAYSHVVTARQTKIDELSEALSYIAKAVGKLNNKNAKSTDKVTVDNASWVKNIAAKYEVSLSWESNGSQMTRGNLQKAQTNVQYAIEREDNDIQQDIVTLQSFISKRDNAYSNASKVIRKANQAADSTINNIGA